MQATIERTGMTYVSGDDPLVAGKAAEEAGRAACAVTSITNDSLGRA